MIKTEVPWRTIYALIRIAGFKDHQPLEDLVPNLRVVIKDSRRCYGGSWNYRCPHMSRADYCTWFCCPLPYPEITMEAPIYFSKARLIIKCDCALIPLYACRFYIEENEQEDED